MTKEVLVSVSGLQFAVNSDEVIEVITGGQYFNRGGKQYILYDEMIEEYEGVSKNTIKFMNGIVDITKKGFTNVHMVFEKDKQNMTCYETPFGSLMVGINAKSIQLLEKENVISLDLEYSLEVNCEHLADCTIKMEIQSKEGGDFRICS